MWSLLRPLNINCCVLQIHVCVNDCKRFDKLETTQQYRLRANEKCTVCGERRFEVKATADGVPRIIPRKVMYWFGVGNTIRDRMFTDPAFCKYRTTGRDEYFYPSDEAKRLAAAANCDLTKLFISCYEIGLDWAQMFSSKVHSTGFIMLRWVTGMGGCVIVCMCVCVCGRE